MTNLGFNVLCISGSTCLAEHQKPSCTHKERVSASLNIVLLARVGLHNVVLPNKMHGLLAASALTPV